MIIMSRRRYARYVAAAADRVLLAPSEKGENLHLLSTWSSKQVKKCDRKSHIEKLPIRTHFRTHSSKSFPHALPHAHRTCGSAILRTCAPQPNI